MFEPLMYREWLQRETENPFEPHTRVRSYHPPMDIEAELDRWNAAYRRKLAREMGEAA